MLQKISFSHIPRAFYFSSSVVLLLWTIGWHAAGAHSYTYIGEYINDDHNNDNAEAPSVKRIIYNMRNCKRKGKSDDRRRSEQEQRKRSIRRSGLFLNWAPTNDEC